ncbi:uncharacterized protein LOC114828150 [Galendromus occidentalis]|uniref:Uncharacterized protein LOC114828150 n=1 Tax=Galendromus occidentalis TaxID=34638 RepID=A0AAJ7SE32_9ACAR|nr:uncharacterized protein LOC114828150 [Galendromus occidentalis]
MTRQVINSCATCKIFHSEAANLPTPPLPSFRLEEAPPFFHTGCDFMGPIRAAKELKLIYEHIKDGEIKRSVVPHFRDLEIIISGIEAMVNSRPITAVASGADEVEALTPENLLFGYKGKTIIPEHLSKPKKSMDSDKAIFSRRWRYQQRLLNSFWKRYHEEYLQFLKAAHEQKPISARPLKIGDVCLLQGESFNRALWPLCRVISFPENIKPENARSCFIKTAKGQTLNRPIRKLFPLEA